MATHSMHPVINSLLDTDLYKFSMQQALLARFPGAQAVYEFRCRNQPQFPLASLAGQVRAELDHLGTLGFSADELRYLATMPFFRPEYLEFLRTFRFNPAQVSVATAGDDLVIRAKGPQAQVMGYEIFVLAIVNELYFRHFDLDTALAEGRKRLLDKTLLLAEALPRPAEAPAWFAFNLFEFGGRRRFSAAWHDEVVRTLKERAPVVFKGTSNVLMAYRHGIPAVGTMAHEYLQTYQATTRPLRDFQRAALDAWALDYRGQLGIALTDTVGMEAFFADFDLYLAKVFDGIRHDSGDPILWGNKAIRHYEALGIDPRTKKLVFSDGLSLHRALSLYRYFRGSVQTGFGIGTHLTNDLGIQPLNIVMKLVECDGRPVAKLSDSPNKSMCVHPEFENLLRETFMNSTGAGVPPRRQTLEVPACCP